MRKIEKTGILRREKLPQMLPGISYIITTGKLSAG